MEQDEKLRSFISNKQIDSMIPQDCIMETKPISFEELVEELNEQRQDRKIVSSIKNGALSNTLNKKGIYWEEFEDYFRAIPGETIYSIQVIGIEGLLKNYSNLPEMPSYCVFKVKRHRILK